MIRHLLLLTSVLILPLPLSADEPSVRIEPAQLQGSRPLEKQTESSVIRDYLQSWKSMQAAFDQNQTSKLDPNFIGTARERLGEAIGGEAKLGLHTHYEDRSHDLQIVFYSPEGLSIQLIDTVIYEQQVFEKDKPLGKRTVTQRYLIVLTPSDVRWQVRIFQSSAI
jgi:hypothetical protein